MPAKVFLIPKKVEKQVGRLPVHIRKRIPTIFIQLRQDPFIGVRLHGELSGRFKLRVGDYRIIYRFTSKTSSIEIMTIEHRQGVYE